MRLCSNCRKEDKPWFEDEPCSCGGAQLHEDDPSPLKHDASCRSLGHEVVLYPIRMPLNEFTYVAGEPVINKEWIRKGWALMRNGQRYYRVKMLCRGCIEVENGIQARRSEYEKACKAARGLDTSTYAQMLTLQTMI